MPKQIKKWGLGIIWGFWYQVIALGLGIQVIPKSPDNPQSPLQNFIFSKQFKNS